MVVFELRTVLLLLLLGVTAAAALAVVVTGRASPRRLLPGGDNATLAAALSAAPFGLLVLEGAQVVTANAYAQRLLRLLSPPAALPDVEWLALLEEDRAAARGDAAGGGRYRTVTFASGQTVRWWVTGLGTRDLVFVFDITTQQRAEQAGRALINDLAHELRTPIATILTHLEVLGLADVGQEVHQQSLALSKDEAQRMARLVNDMLELGRLETATEFVLRPLELVALVEEVLFQALPQATAKRMALSLEASPPLPLALANADRLRQVFLNLLDNALKYAREGDCVVISLAQAETGIACAVCDTGPGIAPEHLPHVTRRFYRAAPKQGTGSGLGLALVAEILRRHNAVLELESRISGKTGTCARFVLPLANVEAGQ